MTRRLTARLERLEQAFTGEFVDLTAETEQYGELRWSAGGQRCYLGGAPDGVRLAVVGAPAGGVVYEIPGVTGDDLR